MDRGVDDAATPYWRTAADLWRVEIIQAPALSRGKSLAPLDAAWRSGPVSDDLVRS